MTHTEAERINQNKETGKDLELKKYNIYRKNVRIKLDPKDHANTWGFTHSQSHNSTKQWMNYLTNKNIKAIIQ